MTVPAPPIAARPFADRSLGERHPDPPALDGENRLTFADFLSVFNPLQHIPIVSTVYRAITGDTIKPAPRVLGGLLFGGPIGLVSAVFNAIIEQETGKDVGEQVLALVRPEPSPPPAQLAVAPPAEVAPPPAPAAPAAAAVVPFHRAAAPASGRPLKFYQEHAGQGLPKIEEPRAASAARIVPFERARAGAMPAVLQAQLRAAPSDAPGPRQDHWFSSAMQRGLDNYQESKRRPAPQVDLMQ